jgi:hypothetical protein
LGKTPIEVEASLYTNRKMLYRGVEIGLRWRRRRELARTLTELRAMAAEARMGLSRMWKWG